MKAIILGATRGMGRAIARVLADRGDELFLLGRDEEQVKLAADDTGVRQENASSHYAICDLLDSSSFEPALEKAFEVLGNVDVVIVTAGLFGTQEDLEEDSTKLERVLQANFTGTILFCEAARKRLLSQEKGTLCVLSSVAGDRGRKPVALYGATKAGLSHYLESLDHKYRAEGLNTICVKPGFVKTGMTAGLKPPPFAGEPEEVAKRVVKAIDRGTPLIYAPGTWRWVMLIIRNLPRFVMRKINF